MLKIKNRLTTKLLLFVFTASFFLIAGSFTYFYFSGKHYITSSAIRELKIYSNRFNQSVNSQINQYSNIISSFIINVGQNVDNKSLTKNVKNILNNNSSKIDEIYLQYENQKKSIVALPITVLFGEQINNINTIKNEQFDSLFNRINVTEKNNNGSEFGYIRSGINLNMYIKKRTQLFSIIIKITNISFYENILNNIYYTDETDFCISESNDVINYSTNKFWINQKVKKYFYGKKIDENFFSDEKRNIIYSEWQSNNLGSKIIISKNISSIYNNFSSLLNNLLLYSIFIYLLIVAFTLFYVNKISKSLNKITDITKQVGDGHFENKIEIKRNDELGLLINSFNKMIDELKISYNKLNLTNKQLREKLDELTQTRIELSKKQKLAFVGEIISKISHEIQNKISGVSVWVQNLEMQVPENENISLYVNEIKSSLNSFMEMLQNFKKFYRKPYLEKKQVDFIKIVEDVIEKYKSDIHEKKIKIEKTFKCNEKTINLDENLIIEVIENLLVNAIYYSPENSTVQIKIQNENSKIIFTICDEGEGIPKENRENIFQPFFTTKSSGSGLGLAIAKNIIEAHNGTLELVNQYETGACFTIILPIN